MHLNSGKSALQTLSENLEGLALDIAGQQHDNLYTRKQVFILTLNERLALLQAESVESLKIQVTSLIASIDAKALQAR